MSLADAQADIESALESLMESGEQAVFSYAVDPVFDDDTGDLISGGTVERRSRMVILKVTPAKRSTEPTSSAEILS